jgi:DNA mismatch endonuclease (patch repair protein)
MQDDEHRERASIRAKRWAAEHPEHKPNLGRKFDDDWRDNMSKSHRGYVMPEEQKRKIGQACKGKTLGRRQPAAAVEKMRQTLLAKGEAASSKRPEVRAKLSRSHGGHNKKQTKPEALLHAVLDTGRWQYIGAGYLADGSANKKYDGRLDVPVGADFVNFSTRTLVFLDGCYWHECPEHGSGRFPNKPAKDKELRDRAQQCGWDVVSVWEHDVRTDAKAVAQLLERTGKNGGSRGDTREKRRG